MPLWESFARTKASMGLMAPGSPAKAAGRSGLRSGSRAHEGGCGSAPERRLARLKKALVAHKGQETLASDAKSGFNFIFRKVDFPCPRSLERLLLEEVPQL